MSAVRALKMSGAGNDFLVLGPEDSSAVGADRVGWVRRISRRGVSVGADGVLFVEPQADGRIGVLFLNPDGSEAFCGNGSRCAARFAELRGMAGDSMVLATAAGNVRAEVRGTQVRLTLDPPRDLGVVRVEAGGIELSGSRIDAGCPHFVALIEDPAKAPLSRWGPAIRRHPVFAPAGVNVDLAACRGNRVALRTWERGVEGETLACGSGAIAAAFAAYLDGAGPDLEVLPASGIPIGIRFRGPAAAPTCVEMESDARVLFTAQIDPEALSWSGG